MPINVTSQLFTKPAKGRRRASLRSNNNKHSGGFPHSDIPGSKGALASPGLIAECHVLHRLLLPRHPPNALIALDPIQKKTGPFAWQWFICQPIPQPGSEVSTRDAPLGRRRPVQQARNGPKARPSSRSVSLDLERLSWLSLDRARRRSRVRTPSPRRTRGRVRTPTRAGPRTSRVLLSSRCQLVLCRDLAIGQEGSPP